MLFEAENEFNPAPGYLTIFLRTAGYRFFSLDNSQNMSAIAAGITSVETVAVVFISVLFLG
ncbi:hypothetical protein DO97_16970 [Neosynechococcus sphagnicola sy1]|uniref:Uncharacterized protein n=1 Tax=Neosynechococcus sphagnicola sy1 TaxID=1497020 RepID=A0A098TI51_9CYAN|nr:hypothetical protein [Neosynechococcus sphagnicola]KGF71657.1 hypothetical protein DO97_16970 [Neosynechococcus sphagnicola sy1]